MNDQETDRHASRFPKATNSVAIVAYPESSRRKRAVPAGSILNIDPASYP